MIELQKKIINCKTMAELDALRVPIINAMGQEQDVEAFTATQSLFIHQKNKIKRHGGKIND